MTCFPLVKSAQQRTGHPQANRHTPVLLACETRRAVTYHLMTVAELKTLIQASRLRATRPSPASVTRVLGGGTCSANPFNNAKGYWITFYHSVRDPARLAEYGALAVPAIEAGGGRFLSRGPAAKTFEGVEKQRTVLVEFDSVARAVQTYQSPQYQAALVLLKGAVERDVRIVEGVG